MEFFYGFTIKIITFGIVIITFLSIPLLQLLVVKKLPQELQATYKKLAKDAFVKTLLMFVGAAFFGALAFFNGDVEKAITQSLFGLCLFAGVSSIWLVIKTKSSINEARGASVAGNRQKKILEIERINSELAQKNTFLSLVIGLIGCTYMVLLYDTYTIEWLWFVAFMGTGPAIRSARWSDAANTAISKYASDPGFGV